MTVSFGAPQTVSLAAGVLTVPAGVRNVAVDPGEAAQTLTQIVAPDMTDGDALILHNASGATPLGVAAGGNLRGLGHTFQLTAAFQTMTFVAQAGQFAMQSAGGATVVS